MLLFAFLHPADAAEMLPVTGGVASGSCGKVGSDFLIGKTEVSNEEYVQFLNAVANKSDPYRLYSPLMGEHFWGGIEKVEHEDGGFYAAKPGYANLPVTFVSWYSAVRFTNWLHYGSPTGPEGLGTTEGVAGGGGAYDTKSWTRNAEAQYWLPSCAEWKAAAFVDPASGKSRPFVSGDVAPEDANFFDGTWAYPFPHLRPVDDLAGTRSPSGTLNQAGNVLEWAEDASGASRLALGGSVLLPKTALASDYTDSEFPQEVLSSIGFRVASRLNPAPSPFVGQQPDDSFKAFQFVEVGHPGNSPDPSSGRGSVPYEFFIGRFEISNSEYVEFLNSVARKGDPKGLFSQDMATGVVGGIIKLPDGRYQAKEGWELRPVTYVSWFDVARLANWLHFGRPSGQQELGTTEGNARVGAYDTSAFPAEDGRYDPSKLTPRNAGATYFIPTDNEWYKAAYHDPVANRYWAFPTRSDVADPGSANFQSGDHLVEGAPYYVSDVTDFQPFASAYGTQQQAGNLWEWLEDWRNKADGTCWRCNEWVKGLRGGSFNYTQTGLSYSNLDPGSPELGLFVYGARLAHIEAGWQPPRAALPSLKDLTTGAKRFASSNPLLVAGIAFVSGLSAALALVFGHQDCVADPTPWTSKAGPGGRRRRRKDSALPSAVPPPISGRPHSARSKAGAAEVSDYSRRGGEGQPKSG